MIFRNPTKRTQMAHVTNLISMARLDGQLTQNEMDYILAVAKEHNLTQAELDQCMKDSDNLVIEVPQSEEDRIEYMKDLVSMVFSEGGIDQQKRIFAEHICEKFGYDGKETVDILYDELMKEINDSEQDGNEGMTEEEFHEEVQRCLEKSVGCFMNNDMSGVFDQLLYASLADSSSRRLFLRIPGYVYPMFMITDKQVDELKKTSDKGFSIARYTLGRYYQLVRPSRENMKKARELFDAAAAKGLGDAFCGLALLARDGWYEEADTDKYNALLDKAIENNSHKAFYFRGKDIIYGFNGRQADPQWVIDTLTDILKDATWEEEKDILNYEPDDFDLLGRAYEETGQRDKAEEAYIHAISMGYYEALSHLATMMCCDEDGNVVEKKSFDEYIGIGIEHNDAWSFAMRGNVSEEEYDALSSKEKVRKTAEIRSDLEKACKLGDDIAPYLLGCHYYFGTNGFAEDDEAAWKWFNLGSAYGSSSCFSMMAQMISEGHCPKKVSERFHAYCLLCACRFGDESKLEDVIEAYRDGLLDDFKNEIEKYYIPRYNDIIPAYEEPDDSTSGNSCLDDIADMEIFDPWS